MGLLNFDWSDPLSQATLAASAELFAANPRTWGVGKAINAFQNVGAQMAQRARQNELSDVELQEVDVLRLHATEALLDASHDVLRCEYVRKAAAGLGRRGVLQQRAAHTTTLRREEVLVAPVGDVLADALFSESVVN